MAGSQPSITYNCAGRRSSLLSRPVSLTVEISAAASQLPGDPIPPVQIPQMQSLSLVPRFPRLPAPPLTSGCDRRFLALFTRVRLRPRRLVTLCASLPASRSSGDSDSSKLGFEDQQTEWSFQVGSPGVALPRTVAGLSLTDQASFLLAFIACTVTDPEL